MQFDSTVAVNFLLGLTLNVLDWASFYEQVGQSKFLTFSVPNVNFSPSGFIASQNSTIQC